MGKVNANSRNNYNTTLGIVDLLDSKIDQAVLIGSDVTFGNITATGDVTIQGDIIIQGDSSLIHTDLAEFKDSILVINSQETAAGVTSNLAGIEIERGTLVNQQIVFQESTDLFKIGQVGNLQAIATREDVPLSSGIMVYNSVASRLDSTNVINIPVAFASGTVGTSSTTGSLYVTGGGSFGVTGDQYTDGIFYIKGSNYSNYIDANGSNELIINPGTNTVFQQLSGTSIKIPTDVNLTFSSTNQKITSNGTNLDIFCSTGNVNITTSSNGNVLLPTNTYIKWDSVGNNRIRYDSTDLTIESTGRLVVNPVIHSTNTTSSTSSTSGAFTLLGGISIDNTTNAVNSTNGGTFTTKGGVAIAKDCYIGQNLDVNGITNLDQTNIDTTDGQFSVSGTSGVDISVGSSSIIKTTSGNLSVNSEAGTLILNGNSAVTIDSLGGISIDSASTSNFSTSSGIMTISGIGVNISGNSGTINISNTSSLVVSSGTGGISVNSTDLTNGIKLGNSNTAPITLGSSGTTVSVPGNVAIAGDLTVSGTTTSVETETVLVKDHLFVVNSEPTGASDGGYSIRRYQTPNNSSTGSVVNDSPKETGTFQTGSSTPGTLVLSLSANASDSYYSGWWIKITSGTGSGQVRRIKNYTGSTRTATIYITADNSATFIDGLDLITSPSNGDSYSLYDCPYAAFYFNESSNELRFTCLALDTSSGTFISNPTSYLTLHADSLILESTMTVGSTSIEGTLTIDHTDSEAFLVRKNSDSGDVFTVDTTNSNIIISNPTNTVSSDVTVLFKQYDSVNNPQTYSQINSVLINNVAGNLRSNLEFSVQKDTSGLIPYISLKGQDGFIDVSTDVDALRILNTSASTSSSNGAVRSSGGISISNTTNASSTTNGGSFTTAGGMAVAKDIYSGQSLFVTGTNQVSTTDNAITGVEGTINTQGDLVLYNGTKNTVIFRGVGIAAPSLTNRSVGTKLVLYPNTTASTTDYAIGMNTTSMWFSV
ncbi:MAG TPA: hypothetical protein V6C58_26665, partial [Allocoleopsis sp.]